MIDVRNIDAFDEDALTARNKFGTLQLSIHGLAGMAPDFSDDILSVELSSTKPCATSTLGLKLRAA